MALEFTIKIEGLKRLADLPKEFQEGLEEGFSKGMKLVEATAKKTFDTANHLKVLTGFLRSSIKGTTFKSGKDIFGKLTAEGPYATIHEFGGRISQYSGRRIITIPARPYLVPSVEENLDNIAEFIETAIESKTNKP